MRPLSLCAAHVVGAQLVFAAIVRTTAPQNGCQTPCTHFTFCRNAYVMALVTIHIAKSINLLVG